MYENIDYDQLQAIIASDDPLLADVRDHDSYEAGHIPGAMHLSIDALAKFCEKAEPNKVTVVYCYHGVSSQSVASYLVAQGFTSVYSLSGGYHAWVDASQGAQ